MGCYDSHTDMTGMSLQKLESHAPNESPGLDDFAHMGLINDLLE